MWTVTDSGLGPLFQVSALWEGLPGNLDAAVYSPRTQWIHFFKGKGTSLHRATEGGPVIRDAIKGGRDEKFPEGGTEELKVITWGQS